MEKSMRNGDELKFTRNEPVLHSELNDILLYGWHLNRRYMNYRNVDFGFRATTECWLDIAVARELKVYYMKHEK